MTALSTRIKTLLRGRLVGEDEYGNKYYCDKRFKNVHQTSRWVMYKGEVEASKVPADWHGWLHHTTQHPPKNDTKQTWQKPHLPNLTGTAYAHYPHGHVLGTPAPTKRTGDYQAWTPDA